VVIVHDLLEIASGLNGLLPILKNVTDPADKQEFIEKSVEDRRGIIEEIMMYRQLRAAENGDILMRIFKRSFSIKGKGRGICKYSVRILAENYLKVKTGFISSERDGTIFFVDLQKRWS